MSPNSLQTNCRTSGVDCRVISTTTGPAAGQHHSATLSLGLVANSSSKGADTQLPARSFCLSAVHLLSPYQWRQATNLARTSCRLAYKGTFCVLLCSVFSLNLPLLAQTVRTRGKWAAHGAPSGVLPVSHGGPCSSQPRPRRFSRWQCPPVRRGQPPRPESRC